MYSLHLAADLFENLTFQRHKRRLTVLNTSTRCGPAVCCIGLAHKKNATRCIKQGSEDAD
jgi:hypothetical protein